MKKEEIPVVYSKWDKKFWEWYNKVFNKVKYTITDGALSPSLYYLSLFRLLIIDREPYDTDEESYSLSEALYNGIVSGEGIWKQQKSLRLHLRQYLAVIKYCMTMKSFTVDDQDIIDYVSKTTEEDFQRLMLSTAYINIKKSDGQNPSVISNLRQYTEQGLDLLKEQIRFFNPAVILGGNIVDGIMNNLFDWGEDLYTNPGVINIFQLRIDDKLYPFIDMNHPSAWRNMDDYYLKLFQALKQVELEHPGFWESRMNLECFKDSTIL